MLSKINQKWMQLDPSQQYLYWIITFAAILFVACMGLVTAISLNLLTIELFPYIVLSILGFVALFGAVVYFLNIVWPHKYQSEKK